MNLGIFAKQQKGKKTILRDVIKEYMDGIEAIYKKNANHLRGLLTNYLNLRRTEEAWDEIIANNFKIKKVWVIGDSGNWGDTEDAYGQNELEAFKDEAAGDRYEIEEISKQDLEIYTRKVAKGEAAVAERKSNPADDLEKRRKEVLKALKGVTEEITLPIEVGTELLGGKFKNKRITVKDIGRNEKGDITINGRPLLKYRLA